MFAIIALSAIGLFGPFASEKGARLDIRSVTGIAGVACHSPRVQRARQLLEHLATSVPLEKYHCICRGLTHAETITDARRYLPSAGGVPSETRLLGGEDIVLARPYRFTRQWPTRSDPRTTEIIAWAVDQGPNRVLTEVFLGHPGLLRNSDVMYDGYLIPTDILELAKGSCSV